MSYEHAPVTDAEIERWQYYSQAQIDLVTPGVGADEEAAADAEDWFDDRVVLARSIIRLIADRARSQKQFPIIPDRRRDSIVAPHPMKRPWSIAELAYSVYGRRGGGDQSLERLAERGGFGASEMDKLLPDWRERVVAL